MPWGLERHYGGGDLHFLTFSCYHRLPFLRAVSRRNLFLEVLEQVRRRYTFVVLGYVVMPEHVHLLLSEPQEKNLSKVMHASKLGFALRIVGEQKRRSGDEQGASSENPPHRFWQARFYDFNVCTPEKRIEKLRYMHRNPMKRGLVSSPELWMWSSFRWYALREPGPVKIEDWSVLKLKIREPVGFGETQA